MLLWLLGKSKSSYFGQYLLASLKNQGFKSRGLGQEYFKDYLAVFSDSARSI